MRTARKRTETATNASKKPKKRKEPHGDGRGDSSKPKKKTVSRKSKKADQREALARSLEAIHRVVLVDEGVSELKLRFSEQSLRNLVESLCTNGELMEDVVEYHRSSFVRLYLENGMKKDPFLAFQFDWHRNCSALLLEEKHELAELSLDETSCTKVCPIRSKWLEFCKSAGFPVPISNPLMIKLSSTVYNSLIEHVTSKSKEDDTSTAISLDGDDVYYRFGGAALCEMLHVRYKQIKTAPLDHKDQISQEITILQAINSKDKSAIPDYMKYRDLGYMYFPHPTFIPFFRHLDTTVKEVVNPSGINKEGNNLIKVFDAHSILYTTYIILFRLHMTE